MIPTLPGQYAVPPRLHNAGGETRRVGIEVEFGGLDVGEAAAVVARVLGGSSHPHDHTAVDVADTRWGTFRVEIDSLPLRERKYLEPLRRIGVDDESETAQWVERSVLEVASLVVPVEVITPPIPVDALAELDGLWTALREAGAQGSDASPLYAFALQLNPEVSLLRPEAVARHLQAYFLLEQWLIETTGVDLVRRMLPYVHAFPEDFVQETIRNVPPTSWDALIGHYVAHNPTRNRPLDLLPLFRYCTEQGLADDAWLQALEEPELVKPRPTFHFRLPDSRIGRADWSPAEAWNQWVAIETLAEDEARLEALRLEYFVADRPSWIERVRRLLAPAVVPS